VPEATVQEAAPESQTVLPLLRRDHHPRTAWTVFGVLAVTLALLSGLLVHALLGSPSDLIKPPTVVGLGQQTAIAQLSAAGLRVDKVTGVFDAQPAGTVIAQSPDKNFFVRRGGSVDLTVSRGIEQTIVPAVVGLSLDEASADMSAAKLVVKTVDRDGNYPAGQVLDVLPRPGTQLATRQTVTLVIASGQVQVPDVRNMDQQSAIAALGAAGFGIGVRPAPSTVSPGTVLAQSPVNVLAPRGSDVVIDVAYDPNATPAPTPAPTGSPPPP
jgi:serine/threonine-protein kinase